MVHEVARAEEFAERRHHAGLEVKEHRFVHVLAALGAVVKHADEVELSAVVAKVLAAAASAVVVAQGHFQLGTHLTTALARLQVYNLARKNTLEVGSMREKKGTEEGKCKKLRVAV